MLESNAAPLEESGPLLDESRSGLESPLAVLLLDCELEVELPSPVLLSSDSLAAVLLETSAVLELESAAVELNSAAVLELDSAVDDGSSVDESPAAVELDEAVELASVGLDWSLVLLISPVATAAAVEESLESEILSASPLSSHNRAGRGMLSALCTL